MKQTLSSIDQQLHAYVDGQLTPEAQGEVERYLAERPEAQQRVRDYRALNRLLGGLHAQVELEPVPERMLRRPSRRRWGRSLGAVAASLLMLGLGVLIGLGMGESLRPETPLVAGPQQRFIQDAAMAHAVFTPEVKHPVEVGAAEEQHLVTWLTKRLNAPLRAPDLRAQGFQLVGGRLLAAEQGPGALLMYENDSGQRVTLYASRGGGQGQLTSFRFARPQGGALFYWIDGDLAYALAGDLERSALLGIAQAVYHQLVI